MGPSWMEPDDYAADVVAGKIVAGKPVVAACERHLADRELGRFEWRPAGYERLFGFLYDAFRVWHNTEQRSVKFEPLPWQAFVLGSLFGWVVKPGDPHGRLPGTRRFRRAYISSGKGSGKSPMMAALGVYMITADGFWAEDGEFRREHQAEAFVMAATETQVEDVSMKTVFDMVDGSPELVEHFGLRTYRARGRQGLTCARNASSLLALSTSARGRGKHGFRVHFVIAEEVHEWLDGEQLRALELGSKGRPQALTVLVTNAAADRTGWCWEQREGAVRAARGEQAEGADSTFGFVAEVDDADVPEPGSKVWHPPERVWRKANPELGATITVAYVREQVELAQLPADRMEALRLLFGHSPGGGSDLVSWAEWLAVRGEVEPEAGCRLAVGIDLGSRFDMTAVAFVWDTPARLYAEVEYWTPGETLAERDRLSSGELLLWAEQGHLHVVPGKVLDYAAVVERIVERIDGFDAVGCQDPYDAQTMCDAAHRVGLDVDLEERWPSWPGFDIHKHPQGVSPAATKPRLWMSRSIDTMAEWIKRRRLWVKPTPVLDWNLANAELSIDPKGNKRWVKYRGGTAHAQQTRRGNIDGLVALSMACGLMEAEGAIEPPPPFHWDDPDFAGSWYGED